MNMARRNLFLFVATLLVIVGSAGATYFLFIKTPSNYQVGANSEVDKAVQKAKELYIEKRAKGEDIKNGPCLSNSLMPGWVADLVHNPRAKVDDLPSNQCSSFVKGQASHFVELDLDGNVVRWQ
jgi:hypothetical protein